MKMLIATAMMMTVSVSAFASKESRQKVFAAPAVLTIECSKVEAGRVKYSVKLEDKGVFADGVPWAVATIKVGKKEYAPKICLYSAGPDDNGVPVKVYSCELYSEAEAAIGVYLNDSKPVSATLSFAEGNFEGMTCGSAQ